jgi:pimeloyl-ACP methyl ester carboxylesterase
MMTNTTRIFRALTRVPVTALTAAYRCPDEEALPERRPVDWNGWTRETVTSSATGETYSYLHHASAKSGAPPMVLVPGLIFDARFFLNAQGLSDEFELFAWDLPLESSLYHGCYGDMARALTDFLEAVSIERAVLLGNSLGAQVAVEFFKISSIEVLGLVLVATKMPDINALDRRVRMLGSRWLGRRSDRYLTCMLRQLVINMRRRIDEPDPQRDVFNVLELRPISFYRQVGAAMSDYDGDTGASLVHCPTLVVHGSEDQFIGVEAARNILEHIPRAELRVVDGAGHEGMFSRGEDFTAPILAWWRA